MAPKPHSAQAPDRRTTTGRRRFRTHPSRRLGERHSRLGGRHKRRLNGQCNRRRISGIHRTGHNRPSDRMRHCYFHWRSRGNPDKSAGNPSDCLRSRRGQREPLRHPLRRFREWSFAQSQKRRRSLLSLTPQSTSNAIVSSFVSPPFMIWKEAILANAGRARPSGWLDRQATTSRQNSGQSLCE
ncbi:MAG: hypothetical protein BWZ10_01485 [candidate division BRC1 bacterium ADurb.BinA364]|nr:MAG: hypothetical protein BWZ10_01485 [candidate division BRC1 bacterium ADurb.BinA364]